MIDFLVSQDLGQKQPFENILWFTWARNLPLKLPPTDRALFYCMKQHFPYT